MKKKAGFTLIELLIVLSIVGIIAAVAIPKFSEIWRHHQNSTQGYNYNYVVTTYSQSGQVLDEFKVKEYYNGNGTQVNLLLEDGSKVVVNGTYKIREVNIKQ